MPRTELILIQKFLSYVFKIGKSLFAIDREDKGGPWKEEDPAILQGLRIGGKALPCKDRHLPDGLSRTKVNANIGTSMDHADTDEELNKLKAALAAGTDSVMDLSTGGDLREIREIILKDSSVMVGAVLIYAVATELAYQGRQILHMSSDMLFDSIEQQCVEGIDYITVHCGVTQRSASLAGRTERIGGIVSRGGSLLATWMYHHKK